MSISHLIARFQGECRGRVSRLLMKHTSRPSHTARRGVEGRYWQWGRGPSSNRGCPAAVQVGRHRLQPQQWEDRQQRRWQPLTGQPQELGAALAAGQALLADLGGPKVVLAKAAPPPPPPPQPLTGIWDKVRLPVPDGPGGSTQSPDLQAQRQPGFLAVIRSVSAPLRFATKMSTTLSGSIHCCCNRFHCAWGRGALAAHLGHFRDRVFAAGVLLPACQERRGGWSLNC